MRVHACVRVYSCNLITWKLGMKKRFKGWDSGIKFPTLTRRPLGVNLQLGCLGEPEVARLSLKREKIGPKITSSLESGVQILGVGVQFRLVQTRTNLYLK